MNSRIFFFIIVPALVLHLGARPLPGKKLTEKTGCLTLVRTLATQAGRDHSYVHNPESFFRQVQAETDPRGELAVLKRQNGSVPYGEFFGRQEVEFVFKKLKDWKLVENLSEDQRESLAVYVVLKAHGLKPGNDAELRNELADAGVSLHAEGKDVTIEALDLAIGEAGSVENTKRIRVYPKGLAEKADNRTLPQATVVFHGDAKGRDAALALDKMAQRRQRVKELRKSGDGVLLIGDLHVLRGEKENHAFEALLAELKDHPPKKLVLGGDIVDLPGSERKTIPALAGAVSHGEALPKAIETELSILAQRLAEQKDLPEILREPEIHLKPGVVPPQFTTESAGKIRFALTVSYLKRIREALPDTEISFIVGNHDVPRLEFLNRTEGQGEIAYAKGKVSKSLKVPHLLPLVRGELKKEGLLKALADANPGVTSDALQADASAWFPALQRVFQIKGSSLATLADHRHYDLGFAAWFTQRTRDFGISTVITDPAAPVQIGDNALVHEPVLLTRDLEITPNLLRIIEPSDNPYGVQPTLNEFTRRVVNFDQHVSSVIERDGANGPGFANVLVGAFSASNVNPGQRYSASVIDPVSGEIYPVSFFDSAKYFKDPQSLGVVPYALAATTRVNYQAPARFPAGK